MSVMEQEYILDKLCTLFIHVHVPPPSHSWMAPLVENMLCDVSSGLTKAVVTGPGRAILFMEDIHWGRV